MMTKISVLLVDDHAVVREGYKSYLSLSEKIGKIYEVDCGEKACQHYMEQPVDVVVMDLSMPGMGGLECIRRLISRYPQCKILVFSIHNELIYATRAIKSGAKGYISKSSAPETLVIAVSSIAQGHTYIDSAMAQKLAVNIITEQDDEYKIKQLSPREFDVFCLLANGHSPRDVAEKLHLSYKTICNHSTAIKEKLAVKTMTELTLIATRHSLIEVDK
ncbi:MAG: response regulator transcription factor [Methyloprofundus sp.]|nr:response regulator transcription factor [Methyloprofundus sp.]